MGGITHEPRLTRLRRLRDQIDTEIATEQVAEARRQANLATQPPPAPEPPRAPASVVRAWALRYGHTTCTKGRLPELLFAMYADANPTGAPR